jgi:hypothetical protein
MLRPHRGTLILVFGILGLVMCAIFGIVAWVMANTDLEAMDRGEMDTAGRDQTQTGKILGIIGTVLLGIGVLVGIGFVVLAVGASTMAR